MHDTCFDALADGPAPACPLLVWDGDPLAPVLADALAGAGLPAPARWPAVPDAGAHAPQHALLGTGAVGRWLALPAGHRPVAGPLSAFGAPPGTAAAWLAAGLTGWWPGECLRQGGLGAALAFDQARWRHEAVARAALARTRAQLDERIWVDRAKGLLMSARGMGEDEAFRLLRGASMQANLRVGEVSRTVIEAAQWAEAVNRSGQLRMLSQRLVKLAAQRLAGVDARRAKALQEQAAERVQATLDHLAGWAPVDPGAPASGSQAGHSAAALSATATAWGALQRALAQRPSPESLAACDREAARLLACAEALTEALEQGSGRRSLRLVNLCGRQRMRVQRVVKQALLADLLGEPARRDSLGPMLDEIEASLCELEAAPLASPEIRQALAAARDQWGGLLRGLQGVDAAAQHAVLARAADALLDLFDRLTGLYERSLQVIMA